jgi:hypothetical protein
LTHLRSRDHIQTKHALHFIGTTHVQTTVVHSPVTEQGPQAE